MEYMYYGKNKSCVGANTAHNKQNTYRICKHSAYAQ